MDFQRNFYKATRNANPSWPVFPHCSGLFLMPTGHFCCPVSTGHSRHSSPTDFCEFLFPTPTGLPLPTSGRVEISSPNTLSGFAPKQTKGSSTWRTTDIVLQIYPQPQMMAREGTENIWEPVKYGKSIY